MDDILFEIQGAIGIATLNRPKALNALSLPMIVQLQKQLLDWQADDAVHAVLVQTSSDRAFCAGGDVRWVYQQRAEFAQQVAFFWHEYRLNHFIHHFKKPYIALMDGLTMGGGVGIALHGSHPVATERFSFAMPETGIGFFPDIGASHLLTQCPGHLGRYLGLTGNSLTALEARAAGLIKHVLPADKLPELLARLQHEDLSIQAHARVDACLQTFALPFTSPTNPDMESCFAHPTVETIVQALQQTTTDWAQAVATTLEKKSPLSLKVTLMQLQKAQGKPLADCLRMDYTLAQHFLKDHDFYEGIRALLIDKDKNPHWHPTHLHTLADETVIHYFEQLAPLQFIQEAHT